jgi:hypothetical protein
MSALSLKADITRQPARSAPGRRSAQANCSPADVAQASLFDVIGRWPSSCRSGHTFLPALDCGGKALAEFLVHLPQPSPFKSVSRVKR